MSMKNYFITPNQAEKYPHLNLLILDLFETKLSPNIASQFKHDKENTLESSYIRIRDEYESIKLIYDLVWEIISDKITEKTTDKKVLKDLETNFLTSEMIQSIKIPLPSKDDGASTLNILSDLLENPISLSVETYSSACSLLKKKIMEEGMLQMELLGKNVTDDNPDLVLAKLNQLPSLILSKINTVRGEAKQKYEAQHQMMEQSVRYLYVLLESLEIIQELIGKHMIEFQSESYLERHQSLKVQADALLLKIKSLYLEILNETYTKETVPALRTISKLLEKNTEQIKGEVQNARVRISRYESVGPEFNNIVSEYTHLRETIKQKKWALDKLKSYCP